MSKNNLIGLEKITAGELLWRKYDKIISNCLMKDVVDELEKKGIKNYEEVVILYNLKLQTADVYLNKEDCNSKK